MNIDKFRRLVQRDILTADELEGLLHEADARRLPAEEYLLERGVPRHEVLFCLSEYHGLPVVEYEEGLVIPRTIMALLDMERQKQARWVALSTDGRSAQVIAVSPEEPAVAEDIRERLGVTDIRFMVALPSDLIRIIENSQDINPAFPPQAGRTPLAKVRTFLADRRSLYSCRRTSLARGRTGLAFLRTGISFITIAVLSYRLFGAGLLAVFDAALAVAGCAAIVDGLLWYLPARRTAGRYDRCTATRSTCGTSVLRVDSPGDDPRFSRSEEVPGASELRVGWPDLSPVMRRRFLASDRTDFAEERTLLACLRTTMARARTGLAFARTGIAFAGLGIAFMKYFGSGPWSAFDAALLVCGIAMTLEGFHWYLPGRKAANDGMQAVAASREKSSIWDFVLAPPDGMLTVWGRPVCAPPVRPDDAPGIWATTGLALERTVLADRRNVMARLRTVMARARTGLAFIRTGMSISAIGVGLLASFGGGMLWTAGTAGLVAVGLVLFADGVYWYMPAERTRRQFPYCFGPMEITIPDYGKTCRQWQTAVFENED